MRWLEFSSGLSAVLFGIWIATPALTIGSGPAASWMLTWLPRESWAFLFCVGGSLQLIAFWRKGLGLRLLTALAALTTWLFVTIGAALHLGTLTPMTLGAAINMALSVIWLILVWRPRRE